MSLVLLGISVLALALGPLLYRMADAARPTLLALDGFVMISVSGLVVVHILPHAFGLVGPLALGLALAGFLGPTLVERSLHRAAQKAHNATLLFACAGLIADAFVDGVALGAAVDDHGDLHGQGSILALAIMLHRVPLAITIWWLVRPSMGLRPAVVVLVAQGVATIVGFGLSEMAGASIHSHWVGLLQALVAGSLLHVVLHQPPPVAGGTRDARSRLLTGLGGLAGLILVGVLALTHMPHHPEPDTANFGDTFLTLAIESAPALLLAFALAGLVQVFLPKASARWMRTGRPWSESVRGMAFGLPLPICSCGVVPLYRALQGQGVPATAAMAFLVATPELGLDAILISLPLLGGEFTLVRVAAAALVALLVGVIIGRMAESARVTPPATDDAEPVVRGSLLERVRLGLRYGFGDIVDHVGPWLLVGLVVASLIEPMISSAWLSAMPWGVEVVVFALLGMPAYVCASGATPLVAILIHKGVSPGAGLAFLLAGPATNITTFGVLAQIHGRRIALAFAAAIAILAIALGLLVNVFMDDVGVLSLSESAPEEPGLFASLCLAALTGVFISSILRQGPRAFVGQILSPYAGSSHGGEDECHERCHTQDDAHDHDHGARRDHDHRHE